MDARARIRRRAADLDAARAADEEVVSGAAAPVASACSSRHKLPPASGRKNWGQTTASPAVEVPAALLENVLANVPLIVWAIDCSGVVMLSEGKDLELIGLKPGELVGQQIFRLYGDVPQITRGVRRALAGESSAGTVELDGVMLSVWYGPLRDADGGTIGAVGVAMDVTEQERAKTELLVEQRMMGEMLRSEERDRQLVAYEIHDGPVQDIAAAQMHLEALLEAEHLPEGPARDEVRIVLGLIRRAAAESRRVIDGLRPPVVDDLGVVPAIECLIGDQPAGGPWIELTVEGEFDGLEPLSAGTVYRIVQEAITNVRRHSKSDRAAVRLAMAGTWIHLVVRDWGVGFDPAEVENTRLGLQGIRERARLLHGRAVIESAPGEGTRVVVDLPVADTPHKNFVITNDRSP